MEDLIFFVCDIDLSYIVQIGFYSGFFFTIGTVCSISTWTMNSRPIDHIKQLNFLFFDRVAQYIQLVLSHIIKCMLSIYFLSFLFLVGIPGIVGVILPAAEYTRSFWRRIRYALDMIKISSLCLVSNTFLVRSTQHVVDHTFVWELSL